jgi:methionine-S-sulfoxide reductase
MMDKLPSNINETIDYSNAHLRSICLAGGCFWGVEAYMKRVRGVAFTEVGYANGKTVDPTDVEVCHQDTGHAEAVCVRYDPEIISLDSLLEHFFRVVDPTSLNRQGNDVGSQYRSGVYYTDPEDRKVVDDHIKALSNINNLDTAKIVTEVMPLTCFYRAEEYHQSYLEKNPGGYCHIRF